MVYHTIIKTKQNKQIKDKKRAIVMRSKVFEDLSENARGRVIHMVTVMKNEMG